MTGLKSFSTHLPEEMVRRLKVHAAETGEAVQDILAEAIDIYLSGYVSVGKYGMGYLKKTEAA